MATQDKPRLAVVGVGDFYRAISPGIDLVFNTVVKVDRPDYEPRPGALRELVGSYSPDAIMLLTPNRVHAEQVEELAELRIPTFVEKPLVTTSEALERVVKSVEVNPALYCSDFYVDVWGVPLLRWLGMKTPTCLGPRTEIPEKDASAWTNGLSEIGTIKGVEATLLEGTGPYASFAGREWLWDSTHGGVLWDMGYHHLAMWFTVINEPLDVLSVERFTIADAPPNASETYGAVQMRSSSGIEFNLRVGKYVETGDDRAFRIIGSKGEISMDFVEPSRLVLNGNVEAPIARFLGSRLDMVAAAFREYVESNPTAPYGLDAGVKSVNLMLDIRSF
jgi:predicted dehydrogenase